MPDTPHEQLRKLAAQRSRLSLTLTFAMTFIYFGFMLLVAYCKEWLGEQIVPGLSWGILLGALVIISAWLLTYIYVRWANSVYDSKIRELKQD